MAFKVGYWPGELGNAPHEPYMQKRIGVRSLFSCCTIKTRTRRGKLINFNIISYFIAAASKSVSVFLNMAFGREVAVNFAHSLLQ